jgi:hypothetical protein
LKWVTRAGASVDRIACPWLIKRFIDPDAEFLFVPAKTVKEVVKRKGAIPYDADGVELTHYVKYGVEYVSFDAIIKKHGIKDPALLDLAEIVRGADAGVPHNPPPESIGLKAYAMGFKAIAEDDFANMRLQFPAYDALYKFCELRRGEKP